MESNTTMAISPDDEKVLIERQLRKEQVLLNYNSKSSDVTNVQAAAAATLGD